MVRLENVSKSFGEKKVLAGISLEVPTDGVAIIQGPSGSGKTTLLRLVAGLILPESGSVSLEGRCVSTPEWGLSPHERNLGFVFQETALWPHMTVSKNILFGLGKLSKKEARMRLDQLLEEMSLTDLAKAYPHQLSGGEARRVALARTLAPRPRYLLMDEPLTNLDPALKESMQQLIMNQLARIQTSLIYVTHDIDETDKMAGQIYIMDSGRLERGNG